jgi:hypothetical protein
MGKKQPGETVPAQAQMLNLLNKHYKSPITNMLTV